MLVSNLKAEPNPRGGRIDLSWTNPSDATFGGVKVLRRETAFPLSGDPRQDQEIGDLPATPQTAGAFVKFVDENLKHETVYYYAVVPYDAINQASRSRAQPSYASAMTTTPYRTAAHLYNNLPAFYRRYDTKLAPDLAAMDPEDFERRVNEHTLASLRVFAFGGLGFLFLASLGVGWVIAGRVLSPISRITAVAN